MTIAENAIPSAATRRAALAWLARVGFAARGLIYLIVSGFAAAAALGLGKEPHGIMDAVQAITGTGLRLALAASTGIGLACLAAYFATVGIWHCCDGKGWRRWLMAFGMLGDAIVYGAVMLSILGLLFGWHADGEQQAQLWTAWAFGKPFGRVVIGLIGFLILACGIGVTGWVLTADIDDAVDLPEDQKRAIEPIGRYGLSGRAGSGRPWWACIGFRRRCTPILRKHTSLAGRCKACRSTRRVGSCCCRSRWPLPPRPYSISSKRYITGPIRAWTFQDVRTEAKAPVLKRTRQTTP